MIDRSFPADAFPVVVAHRGASSSHPENTLPAFEAALALGAPVVELDVRLTADGHAVVMHDADVSRTTDGEGFVHEMTFEQVRGLEAGTLEHPARVPLLSEVLDLVSGRGGVAIEIKNLPGDPGYEPDGESSVAAALAEVERVGFDGPVLVLSFNPRSIAAARAADAGVATGLLTTDAIAPDDGLAFVVEQGHEFLLPGSRGLIATGFDVVERAQAAGVRLGTWTIDDPATFARVIDAGVDAIATNDPAMGLDVLGGHRPA
ncbi:MAG: glycerophosphodiester phosphodiesterase [Actinomycetota bacterium]